MGPSGLCSASGGPVRARPRAAAPGCRAKLGWVTPAEVVCVLGGHGAQAPTNRVQAPFWLDTLRVPTRGAAVPGQPALPPGLPLLAPAVPLAGCPLRPGGPWPSDPLTTPGVTGAETTPPPSYPPQPPASDRHPPSQRPRCPSPMQSGRHTPSDFTSALSGQRPITSSRLLKLHARSACVGRRSQGSLRPEQREQPAGPRRHPDGLCQPVPPPPPPSSEQVPAQAVC